MRKNRLVIFLFLVMICGYSFAQRTPQVYIAGYDGSNAVYWLNGNRFILPKAGEVAQASAIAVSGSNVYIAGYDGNDAVYWLNGKRILLPKSGEKAQVNAIAVAGSNVYFAGNDGDDAVYWLNGNCVVLPKAGEHARANAIAISDSNVYIAGWDKIGDGAAVYWLNDTRKVILAHLEDYFPYAEALAIAVSGSNVYIAGKSGIDNGSAAVYWLNGKITYLPAANINEAKAISLIGSDVYIAGWRARFSEFGQEAVFWKNENRVDLDQGNARYAQANAMATANSNIYVAGFRSQNYFDPMRVAGYWLNGNINDLPTSERASEALAIAVIQ